MSKRTLALIIVLLIVTVVLIIVAIAPKTNQTTKYPTPSPTPIAQSVLTIIPNPINTSTQSATAQVIIDSGQNKVTAVQLELSYDPKKITKVTIAPGDFLENSVVLLNNIDAKEGRISYALGISPSGVAKKGKGTVANVSLQTNLAPGEKTEITVLPKTLVTAEGISSSVLKTSSGTIILFTPPTPTQKP